MARTEGNPFFLNQFLSALVEERILYTDNTAGDGHWQWRWSSESVRNAGITDNIVELMVAKLHKLPAPTRQVLQVAACMGNTFDLKSLSDVCGLAAPEAARRLWSALQAEVIVPLDDHYKFAEHPGSVDEARLRPTYRFLHDRVHQAANLLSDEAAKSAMHLAIGRLWLATYSHEEQQELLFDLVNHLNAGWCSMSAPAERRGLAQLNLNAAKRAKASIAYKPALLYVQTALGLLIETDWQTQYEMMLALHLEGAEAASLNADFITMDAYLATALHQVTDLMDRVKVYEIRIQALITQDKFLDTVGSGLDVLRFLGVTFPKKPKKVHVTLSLLQTKSALAGKNISTLEQLRTTDDPRLLAIKSMLTEIRSAAYYELPRTSVLLRLKAMRVLVEHGHSAQTSASDFGAYSVIASGILHNFEEGAQFGDLALRLLDRPGINVARSRIMYLIYAGVHAWTRPLLETLRRLKQAFLFGVEFGDVQYAFNSAHVRCLHSLYCGVELIEIERETDAYLQAMAWPSVRFSMTVLRSSCQRLRNPSGFTDTALGSKNRRSPNRSVQGDDSNESPRDSKSSTFVVLSNRVMFSYFLCDYQDAFDNLSRADVFVSAVVAFVGGAVVYFYSSLVRLALLDTVSSLERLRFFRIIKKNQQRMKRWARSAPSNFQRKWQLVEAELAGNAGRKIAAIHGYEEAIRLAHKNNYPQEVALAKELAGEYFLKIGIVSIAKMYLGQAQQGYRHWVALAKVGSMARQYPEWLGEQVQTMQTTFSRVSETMSLPGAGTQNLLDVAAVMKTMQALSQEITLVPLLRRLIEIMMESAGAERGLLLLKEDEHWHVRAEKVVG